MKYRIRLGEIPDGNTPLVGQAVTARSIATGLALGAAVSDSQGLVTIQADGHWEPFYLHLSNIPGGDKFWRSDESHTNGPLCPKDLPASLRALGDGVVRGYASSLAVSLSDPSTPTALVFPGSAVVAGHPVVFYNTTTVANTRPFTGTRYDRIIIRLNPEGSSTTPGKADLALLQGAVDGGIPTLTQSTEVYELSLATLTIPAAGAISLNDDRQFAAEPAAVNRSTASPGEVTSSTFGVYFPNLDISLPLTEAVTYDIQSYASAFQDILGGRVLKGTFGTFGNGPTSFNGLNQVALAPNGDIYVADTNNARVTILNSSGGAVAQVGGLYGISGVCFDGDGSGHYYVAGNDPFSTQGQRGYIRRHDASHALVWSQGSYTDGTRHITEEGGSLFIVTYDAIQGTFVFQVNTADGSTIRTVFFNTVAQAGYYGIASHGGEVFLVDTFSDRIIVFNTAGVIQRTWNTASGCIGIDVDVNGHAYVTKPFADTIYHYVGTGFTSGTLVDTTPQEHPWGIAVAPDLTYFVGNTAAFNVAKWSIENTGYGELALEINGDFGPYMGIGNVTGTLQGTKTQVVAGPATVSCRIAGKATSGSVVFRNLVHSVRAVPRGV